MSVFMGWDSIQSWPHRLRSPIRPSVKWDRRTCRRSLPHLRFPRRERATSKEGSGWSHSLNKALWNRDQRQKAAQEPWLIAPCSQHLLAWVPSAFQRRLQLPPQGLASSPLPLPLPFTPPTSPTKWTPPDSSKSRGKWEKNDISVQQSLRGHCSSLELCVNVLGLWDLCVGRKGSSVHSRTNFLEHPTWFTQPLVKAPRLQWVHRSARQFLAF